MQLALERCPKSDDVVVEARRAIKREIFCQGYAAAENTLALTWEDMVLLRTLFDATDANQSMGALTVQPMTRAYYEYLLQEFNEQRKK